MSLSSPSILKPTIREPETAGTGSRGIEPCPICGNAGARRWLRAPDRFHGRRQLYTLLRCPICELVWLSHPPRPEQMAEHYTDAYHRLISATGYDSPVRWRDRRAALIQYKQGGSLLDLGCSSGSFLEFLKGGPWKLHGIEMSRTVLKSRKKRAALRFLWATFWTLLSHPNPSTSSRASTCSSTSASRDESWSR